MTKRRPLLREVKRAEADYADAVMRWGENNLVTVRALIRWQDLKEARDR